jgi:hypothetical protein
MGMKSDTYQTRVCGHHPETCTCRDLDIAIKLEEITREERESELKKLRVTDVSGQSELLESFVKFVNERQFNKFQICLDEVELFLDSNCT